ncbi:hypothetical protein KM043_016710 [Ampulex compressa]|nr:hypothetical protein KM043_016710 [Ampulex compressa]
MARISGSWRRVTSGIFLICKRLFPCKSRLPTSVHFSDILYVVNALPRNVKVTLSLPVILSEHTSVSVI